MLNYIGEREKAAKIENALMKVLGQGAVLTPDLGGNAGTNEFTDEIIKNL